MSLSFHSDYTIFRTTLGQCSKELLDALFSMTLLASKEADGSEMYNTLAYRRHEYGQIEIAVAQTADGDYLGWTLTRPDYIKHKLIMVYVKPEHRRKGIGRALHAAIAEKPVVCQPWNAVSDSFFKNLRVTPSWDLSFPDL